MVRRSSIEGYVTEIITDVALDWLKNGRDKSKPFLLMCHHKAPHREWEPALKNLPLFEGVKFPEPPTLFDDYAGRGKAEHQQDMMIATTMNDRDLKFVRPPRLTARQQADVGRLLQSAERGIPKAAISKGPISCAGNTSATCTTTWPASPRSTRAWAGCWTTSRKPAWSRIPSWSTPPIRASTSASTAGSTSDGSSKSRCARPCWFAGRA